MWTRSSPDGRDTTTFSGDLTPDGEPLPVTTTEDPDDDEPSRRLVLPWLRDVGLGLALLLAPLLVVTLAVPRLPFRYALGVFLLGLVAVVAWRQRDDA